MIKIPTFKYLINEDEAKTIEKCLAYAEHRFISHENSGIHKAGVKVEQIEKLLKEFKN